MFTNYEDRGRTFARLFGKQAVEHDVSRTGCPRSLGHDRGSAGTGRAHRGAHRLRARDALQRERLRRHAGRSRELVLCLSSGGWGLRWHRRIRGRRQVRRREAAAVCVADHAADDRADADHGPPVHDVDRAGSRRFATLPPRRVRPTVGARQARGGGVDVDAGREEGRQDAAPDEGPAAVSDGGRSARPAGRASSPICRWP